MIRFVGQQDVHSPFVHVYTTSLLSDVATIKIFPDNPDPSDLEGHTLWTHLRTVEVPSRASHWSCRKNKFWPLRVVLEGPTSTDIVPSADAPPSPIEERPRHRSSNRDRDRRSDDEAPLSPSTQSNTRANSAFVNHPKRQVVEPPPVPPPTLELPPPPPGTPAAAGAAPTILASVKQLGVAVAHAIPPQVQTTIQSQVAALRSWMKKGEEGEEGGSEDEEARRERRRARRQARREKEEMESMGGSRGGRREREREGEREFESREEKEARRAERRARAQTMG